MIVSVNILLDTSIFHSYTFSDTTIRKGILEHSFGEIGRNLP